jgi:outer membrane protein assembly factor BamB
MAHYTRGAWFTRRRAGSRVASATCLLALVLFSLSGNVVAQRDPSALPSRVVVAGIAVEASVESAQQHVLVVAGVNGQKAVLVVIDRRTNKQIAQTLLDDESATGTDLSGGAGIDMLVLDPTHHRVYVSALNLANGLAHDVWGIDLYTGKVMVNLGAADSIAIDQRTGTVYAAQTNYGLHRYDTQRVLAAYSPSGKVVWQHAQSGHATVYCVDEKDKILLTAVAVDGMTPPTGNFVAVDTRTGNVRWHRHLAYVPAHMLCAPTSSRTIILPGNDAPITDVALLDARTNTFAPRLRPNDDHYYDTVVADWIAGTAIGVWHTRYSGEGLDIMNFRRGTHSLLLPLTDRLGGPGGGSGPAADVVGEDLARHLLYVALKTQASGASVLVATVDMVRGKIVATVTIPNINDERAVLASDGRLADVTKQTSVTDPNTGDTTTINAVIVVPLRHTQ